MKWYNTLVKRILKGIILFLLPVMLVLILLKRAAILVRSLIDPLQSFLPEGRFLGVGMITVLTLIIILAICYLAGWRAEKKGIKSFLPFFEDHILVLIPGYSLLKSNADEVIGASDRAWKPVAAGDENGDWKFGLEVEQHSDGYSAVFFPEPPDAKSGEIKLIHSSKLKRINIPASKLITTIRKYGHGSASLTDDLGHAKT